MTAFSMLALGAISARAVWIGGAEHDTLSRRALNENTKPIPLLAARGTILSSNGQALAQDRPATQIAVDPKVVKNAARVAALIAPPLRQSVGQVQAALAKTSRNEILEPFATPSVATQLRDIKRNQLVDGAVIDGVDLTDVLQRVDPHGRVGSQVVGLARPTQKEDKTTADKVGISGLEARYNRELTGTSGLQLEARDPAGRTIRTISTKPAVPGKTLRTSIDPGIQLTVQDVLDRTVAANGAKSASAIVMRPSDGAILAIASNPGFDPNNRAGMTNEATNVGPVTEVFEPGSVFKLVAVAGAIQDGVVTPSTVYKGLHASETLYDYTVGESHRTETRDMSVAEIIRTSSNIGTGHIAKDLGRDRFLAWTHRFGFGAQTGVDLPGEAAGHIRPAQEWSGVDISQLPIGQGLTTTVVQIARAYAVVANGGLLVTPHVVTRIGGQPVSVPKPERVLRPDVAAQMNTILEAVVDKGGTGGRAHIDGFRVAGKTGTGSVFDPELFNSVTGKNGAYSKSRFVASFVGYVPANKPQLLIVVSVNEPSRGQYYGGEVAAPAFKEIAEYSLQHLAIAP